MVALFVALAVLPSLALAATYSVKDVSFEVSAERNTQVAVQEHENLLVRLAFKLKGLEKLVVGEDGDTVASGARTQSKIKYVSVGFVGATAQSSVCSPVYGDQYPVCDFPLIVEVPRPPVSYESGTALETNYVFTPEARTALGVASPGDHEILAIPFIELMNGERIAYVANATNIRTSVAPTANTGFKAAQEGQGQVLQATDSLLDNAVVGSIVSVINIIIAGLLSFAETILYTLFTWLISPMIVTVLSIHTYTDKFANVVYFAWEIFRNLANILFILVLIAIGLATIFRVSGWQAKELLVKLILGALLVNFSLLICQGILGVADTVQNQFLPDSQPAINQIAYNLVLKGTLESLVGSVASLGNTTTAGALAVSARLGILFILGLGSVMAFLAIMVFLIIRIVALWLLIMTSPLPYAAMALPSKYAGKYSGMWWSNFIKYAFQTPILAFMLNVTALIAERAGDPTKGGIIKSVAEKTGNSGGTEEFLFTVGSNIVLIAFMMAGIKISSSFGTWGSKKITGMVAPGMALLGAQSAKVTAGTAGGLVGGAAGAVSGFKAGGFTGALSGAASGAKKAATASSQFAGGVTNKQYWKDAGEVVKGRFVEAGKKDYSKFQQRFGRLDPKYLSEEVFSKKGPPVFLNKMKVRIAGGKDAAQRQIDEAQKYENLLTDDQRQHIKEQEGLNKAGSEKIQLELNGLVNGELKVADAKDLQKTVSARLETVSNEGAAVQKEYDTLLSKIQADKDAKRVPKTEDNARLMNLDKQRRELADEEYSLHGVPAALARMTEGKKDTDTVKLSSDMMTAVQPLKKSLEKTKADFDAKAQGFARQASDDDTLRRQLKLKGFGEAGAKSVDDGLIASQIKRARELETKLGGSTLPRAYQVDQDFEKKISDKEKAIPEFMNKSFDQRYTAIQQALQRKDAAEYVTWMRILEKEGELPDYMKKLNSNSGTGVADMQKFLATQYRAAGVKDAQLDMALYRDMSILEGAGYTQVAKSMKWNSKNQKMESTVVGPDGSLIDGAIKEQVKKSVDKDFREKSSERAVVGSLRGRAVTVRDEGGDERVHEKVTEIAYRIKNPEAYNGFTPEVRTALEKIYGEGARFDTSKFSADMVKNAKTLGAIEASADDNSAAVKDLKKRMVPMIEALKGKAIKLPKEKGKNVYVAGGKAADEDDEEGGDENA